MEGERQHGAPPAAQLRAKAAAEAAGLEGVDMEGDNALNAGELETMRTLTLTLALALGLGLALTLALSLSRRARRVRSSWRCARTRRGKTRARRCEP